MKKISTNQFEVIPTKTEEMFLEELRKQNWLFISTSTVLKEEIFLSLQ